MQIFLIYSYIYNRHLNYHRSKEQVRRRFEKLDGSCEELQELADRFLLDAIEKMENFTERKIKREDIRIYIVDRERGGSFHEPLTLNFDEDQKFMFAELLHLIGHHMIEGAGALTEAKINLIVETILEDLPLNFSRQINRLHENQQSRYPEYFRLDPKQYDPRKKTIPTLFPPIVKDEE